MSRFTETHLMHFCNLTHALLRCKEQQSKFLLIAKARVQWSLKTLSTENTQYTPYTPYEVRKDLMDEFMSCELVANLQLAILTLTQGPEQTVLEYSLMHEHLLGLLNEACLEWMGMEEMDVALINERVALDSYQSGLLSGRKQKLHFTMLQEAINYVLELDQKGLLTADPEAVVVDHDCGSTSSVGLKWPLRDVRNRRTSNNTK